MWNLFGKPSSSSTSSRSQSAVGGPSKEQIRAWSSALKKEQRNLDRDRNTLIREEAKLKVELKKIAKTGNVRACHTMAKSVLQSQRQCDKLLIASTRINSVVSQLKIQAATANVVGQMQKSGEIMAQMNSLVKIPAIAAAAKDMSREMAKTGLIDEMIDDALGMNDDDLVEAADQEVDRVLFEITDGMLGQIGELKGRNEPEAKQRQTQKAAVTNVEPS